MFDFIKKKKLAPTKDESYKYIANQLIDLSKKENHKVFAFTSSNNDPNFIIKIVRNLAKNIASKKIKTLVIKSIFNNGDSSIGVKEVEDFLESIKLINIECEKFEKIISENAEKYDLILVSVPSVILKASALEYAKVCKEIVIAEKYTKCYYSDYENTLETLKMANIKASGVITVC